MPGSTVDMSNLPAEALNLGTALAEYPSATGRNLPGGLILLGMSTAICGLGALFYQTRQLEVAGLAVMLSCGVLVLIGAVYALYFTIHNSDLRIVVFEKGFARDGGS